MASDGLFIAAMHNINMYNEQTGVHAMNKLKLIRSLSLLSVFMISAVAVVANAQTMSTDLNTKTLIPGQDPYCDPNGSYTSLVQAAGNFGTTVSDAETTHLCPRVELEADESIPSHVVDWVLVELRAVANSGTAGSTSVSAADGTTVIARKPAFLLTNGRVVDAELYLEATDQDPTTACAALAASDNCPEVLFDEGDVASEVNTKDLYIVIRHINHLDIISSGNIAESSDAGVYAHDFTDASTKANGGVSALKPCALNSISDKCDRISHVGSASVFAMYGGDADASGGVNLTDYSAEIGHSERFGRTTYLPGDTDMSGGVNLTDYTAVVRGNIGEVHRVP